LPVQQPTEVDLIIDITIARVLGLKIPDSFLMGANEAIESTFRRHVSRLNQVEIWFSILVRKLLRREYFASRSALCTKIEQFIAYFRHTSAEPLASLSGEPCKQNLSPAQLK
jgi:hypothetical protein